MGTRPSWEQDELFCRAGIWKWIFRKDNDTPGATLRSRVGISPSWYLLISVQVNVIFSPDTWSRQGKWTQCSVSQTQPGLEFPNATLLCSAKRQRGEIDFLSHGSWQAFNKSAVSVGSLAGSGISISKYKRLKSWNTRSSNTNDSWILLGAWKQVRNSGFWKGTQGRVSRLALD